MKTSTKQIASTVKPRHGFIDALVVHHQDFSSYVNLRNLLIFLIDRLSKLSDKEQITTYSTQISQTTVHLKSFSGTSEQDRDLERIIGDIIDESDTLVAMLDSSPADESDFEIQTLITARSTQIHWLCVCGLEELKRNLPSVH
ncbi:MAG: hypothetical protein GX639_04075 [Fibrobacter sp.]|nr:hypothetical protein [Fibrobacter sp.]